MQNVYRLLQLLFFNYVAAMKTRNAVYKGITVLVILIALPLAARSFELLSEGAMGSVSAVTANSAEEIINIAGSTAAGLRIDDEYEALPFKSNAKVDQYATDEVSEELNYALTKEVGAWAETLRKTSEDVNSSALEVGYIDELPQSSFDEAAFVVRDEEFDRLVFRPETNREDGQNDTIYQLGRVEQTITKLQQNLDSVQYIIERKVDFVATIDASISDDTPSIGSGYITNLTSVSNVKIAAIRD